MVDQTDWGDCVQKFGSQADQTNWRGYVNPVFPLHKTSKLTMVLGGAVFLHVLGSSSPPKEERFCFGRQRQNDVLRCFKADKGLYGIAYLLHPWDIYCCLHVENKSCQIFQVFSRSRSQFYIPTVFTSLTKNHLLIASKRRPDCIHIALIHLVLSYVQVVQPSGMDTDSCPRGAAGTIICLIEIKGLENNLVIV